MTNYVLGDIRLNREWHMVHRLQAALGNQGQQSVLWVFSASKLMRMLQSLATYSYFEVCDNSQLMVLLKLSLFS